jgi:NAD(P)-dependent dehydrogenase (short-subunit alcohol dehydrogenase family)
VHTLTWFPKVRAHTGRAGGSVVSEVVVVTGIGGMGVACARRVGNGRRLVIADFNEEKLGAEAEHLAADGFDVTAHAVDVSDRASVTALAARADSMGTLRTVVHNAGLSPTQASAARVLEVDMLGTDYVLAEFLPLVTEGTVAVCIASMAGYMAGLIPERERALAVAPTDALLDTLGPVDLDDFGGTYGIAKRINQLRVEQAAGPWGTRGGRVVSISPGIISTPMTHQELAEGAGEQMRGMLDLSPVARIGTAEDIAAAVAWLASPEASFVSGCDLRVDGGVTGIIRGLIS